MKKSRLSILASGAVLALSVISAQAALTFSFHYTDVTNSSGTGFDDPTDGAARRASLESAGQMLASYFVGYDVAVSFTVNSETSGGNTLAYANSAYGDYPGGGSSPGFYQSNVQNFIQNGTGASDGTITYNFAHAWDYDDDVSSGYFDFKSTAMHEILHTFGFASAISPTGQGGFDSPVGDPDGWAYFDRFLTDNTGTALINGTTYAFQGDVSVLTGGSANGVFFGGSNAVNAYGGLVPIYSPGPYEEGSSGSHTDDFTFSYENQLMMNAASGTGPGIRTLSALELGILADLGYNVSAVPEPSSYALILGAGVLLAVAFRRHRRRG